MGRPIACEGSLGRGGDLGMTDLLIGQQTAQFKICHFSLRVKAAESE